MLPNVYLLLLLIACSAVIGRYDDCTCNGVTLPEVGGECLTANHDDYRPWCYVNPGMCGNKKQSSDDDDLWYSSIPCQLTYSSCPLTPPTQGSPCTNKDLVCSYGKACCCSHCLGPSINYCTEGVWAEDTIVFDCPETCETEGIQEEKEGIQEETEGIQEYSEEIQDETRDGRLTKLIEVIEYETEGIQEETEGIHEETRDGYETEGIQDKTEGIQEETEEIQEETEDRYETEGIQEDTEGITTVVPAYPSTTVSPYYPSTEIVLTTPVSPTYLTTSVAPAYPTTTVEQTTTLEQTTTVVYRSSKSFRTTPTTVPEIQEETEDRYEIEEIQEETEGITTVAPAYPSTTVSPHYPSVLTTPVSPTYLTTSVAPSYPTTTDAQTTTLEQTTTVAYLSSTSFRTTPTTVPEIQEETEDRYETEEIQEETEGIQEETEEIQQETEGKQEETEEIQEETEDRYGRNHGSCKDGFSNFEQEDGKSRCCNRARGDPDHDDNLFPNVNGCYDRYCYDPSAQYKVEKNQYCFVLI